MQRSPNLSFRASAAEAADVPISIRLLLSLALANLGLHLLSSAMLACGYMSGELYYLDCAERLACGYVDHPPAAASPKGFTRRPSIGRGTRSVANTSYAPLARCTFTESK